jgi:L-asparaginase
VESYVALLTTGGTVSTTTDVATGRSAPTLGPHELTALARLLGIRVVPRELSRVPSWTLDPPAIAGIALAARDAARDPAVVGVVVTHGTTTLEYSAFFTDLVLDVPTPVVFTGAMRRADDPEADGAANLRDAIHVAAAPEARGLGALVVFAGHVIPARRAWKARRVDPDAFVALDGDLGRVGAAGVEIVRRPTRRASFSGRLDPRVGFVKAVPGADGRMIEAVLAADVRGLVIEGLPGVGGIPPGMREAVVAAAARMPVVLASRAPFGRLPTVPTGGTGEPLREADLLSAGDLTAEGAWLLLMAALGEGGTDDDVKRRFRGAASSDP